MMKTVTATAGQTEVDQFLATPVVSVHNYYRGGISIGLGVLDDVSWPVVSGNILKLSREEAGELAAALLQLGADDAPVRAVLKIADA